MAGDGGDLMRRATGFGETPRCRLTLTPRWLFW
jgi:hypothetical protein